MRIQFCAFGDLRRYMPGQQERLDLDVEENTTVADVLQQLGVSWGEVGLVAVNGKMSDENYKLQEGDKVETFSPIGGG